MLLKRKHPLYEKSMNPQYVEKLVKVTQEPKPLIYKLHPIPSQQLKPSLFPHP